MISFTGSTPAGKNIGKIATSGRHLKKIALELANGTEFDLSSALFSGDLDRGLRFASKIRAGTTHVNDMPVNDEAHKGKPRLFLGVLGVLGGYNAIYGSYE